MVLNVAQNMAIPEAAATLRAYINRPSRELKENWEVDLASLLQDYFQYLFKELEKSDNVKNAANFAEAALIIQASSEIYCKKVDYLWEQMVKLLNLLQSQKTDDPKDKQKCGRSRVDELEKSRLFEEVLRKVVVPDLKNGMAEKVKLLVDHFHLLVKLREKQLYEDVDDEGNSVDVDEGEITQQEALNRNLTNKELLKKPLFPPSFWIDAFQIIEAGLRKLLHLGPEDPIDYAAVDAECERHKEQRESEAAHVEENATTTQLNQENAPSVNTPQLNQENAPNVNAPDTQHNEENGKPTAETDVGYGTCTDTVASPMDVQAAASATTNEAGTSTTVDGDLCVLTPAENTSIGSPPPPPPEPPPLPPDQTFSVLETIPEQTALAEASPLPSTFLDNDDEEVLAGGRSARRREKIVTLLSPWAELLEERLYHEKAVRKRKTCELTADHIATIESLRGRITVRHRICSEYLRRDSFLAQHGIRLEASDNVVPAENRVSVIYLIDVKHKKRLIQELEKRIIFEDNLEALRKKYSQDLEEDFRGFEDLEPSDEETDGFHGFPSLLRASNNCAAIDDDDEEGFRGFPDESSGFRGFPDENQPETQQKESNDPAPPEPENTVKPPERREKDDNAPVIETEAVKKWREFIDPKLTRAWERGHFEIHEYESQILDAFPQDSSTRTLSFAEIVADKPTEDVPRYFLAALQLANSCNIEIGKSDPDPLAMDCLEVTLLSSTRQHEALGEFHAPSELSQGVSNPFTAVRQPFATDQPHSSHQYVMLEDSEKPSRKRKCNQSKCKEAEISEEEDEAQESDDDEWWLEPKKVARKRKLNKR